MNAIEERILECFPSASYALAALLRLLDIVESDSVPTAAVQSWKAVIESAIVPETQKDQPPSSQAPYLSLELLPFLVIPVSPLSLRPLQAQRRVVPVGVVMGNIFQHSKELPITILAVPDNDSIGVQHLRDFAVEFAFGFVFTHCSAPSASLTTSSNAVA